MKADTGLIRRAIRRRLYKIRNPYWYRAAVGGMWETIGKLQFVYLTGKGLRPRHHLLDVGCGSLRGGIHFVRYLEAGHYFGIDINKELLDAGRSELRRNDLTRKNPTLVQMGDFDFQSLGQEFDYASAHGVFTHLPFQSLIRCLVNIEKVLVRGGQFWATFWESPEKFTLDPVMHARVGGGNVTTYFDKDPYHYDFEAFKWMCEGTKLRPEYVGSWKHPRGQKRMMVFTKI